MVKVCIGIEDVELLGYGMIGMAHHVLCLPSSDIMHSKAYSCDLCLVDSFSLCSNGSKKESRVLV